MRVLLLAALLVAAAYQFGMYMFGRRGQISRYTAGVEFLLLGAFLNSGLVIEQPQKLFEGLLPFVHIELAWIGLLYGIQYEWRGVRRENLEDLWLVGLESFATMLLVFVIALVLLPVATVDMGVSPVPAAILLAIGASISSPWTLGNILFSQPARQNLIRKLQLIAILDDIPGFIVFFILFFACCSSPIEAIIRIGVGTFTGLTVGKIIAYLLRGRIESWEPLLVLIGAALLSAGISFSINIPVLYVTLISGLVIANSRPRRRDLFPVLAGSEHLLYLLFLVMAGAFWDPTNVFAFILSLVLILIRYSSKWLSFELSKRFIDIPGWGGHLALSLISPGGLAVAMIMNIILFRDRFPLANLVLDVTVWALIILSPAGLPLAKRMLMKLDEKR